MTQHRDQIDQFLAQVLQQAPQLLHRVFALDGANEVLPSLKTAESKIAYLIQVIALELHKASKEIDSTKLTDGPNDIKFHVSRTARLLPSAPFNITTHELGEFEDLYYAACAKLKELLQGVDIRLNNGFKCPSDTYFTYRCSRLHVLDPVSVGDFRASLLVYETILYSHQLSELLNKGVVRKRMRDNKYETRKQQSCAEKVMRDEIEHVKDDRHGLLEHEKEHAHFRHGVFQKNLGWLSGVSGLQDTKDMSCSMINASLTEMYRTNNKFKGSSITRQPTPDVPQFVQESKAYLTYVSPYNLEERAKKLNVPGGPEMPCICDPDCMCALVCASDPTQNCLCEENSLFARVTEGMDIDDLDVPDLVRLKGQGSETSGSSAASLIDAETYHDELDNKLPYAVIDDCYDHRFEYTDHSIDHQQDQQYEVPDDMDSIDTMSMSEIPDNMSISEVPDTVSVSDILESSELNEHEFWETRGVVPLRVSSLAYREALRQPFAKECPYPPKRSSVTQRLFSSRKHRTSTNKPSPTIDKATKDHSMNGNGGKVLKQTTKRSLADMSFASLKHALRRDSRIH